LVFGNEVKGVEPDTCDASEIVVEIPQFGVKQSLNVSVCAGIVLWHAAQRIGLPG
ncbi:MAG: TrmH family RNA methyltransferase, partial [Flavobacteriales bacterium]|nr:TrmH family RNA methyltransferase [Flavobacteriales bacterium]